MGIVSKVYDLSPVTIQNLMCSAKGYLIKRRRFSKGFFAELEKFEARQYDGTEELVSFLAFCSHVSYYKDVIDSSFIEKLTKDNAHELLRSLPIISKADVKSHLADLDVNNEQPVITMHTSGTTGSGLVFPYSVEMENKQWAVWWRYRRALGIQLDTWCGWLGGRTIIPMSNKKAPYWRINRLGRQVMYSSHHLTKDTVKNYYQDIKNRGITWLHGYPSSASLLASLIIEQGLEPIESVQWVTTGAENLLEHHIKTIKRAFPNAIVRTHYGLAEGVANFSQDKEGEWHVDDDFCYVEFIPLDEADSSVCKIVGTGFSNKVFPLVRYDTGDLAKINWIDGKPEIIEVYGRQEDYIELPNGVKLGRLDHIFKDCINIKEAQIHQIRKDLIELRIVKDNNYTQKDEKFLKEEASSRFGKDVELKITYCDQIERTKAGKVRFVVSDLKK